MRVIKLMVSSLVMVAAAAVHGAPSDTILARQKSLKQIGGATKAAGDTLKTPSPDLAVIKASAATINGLAPKLVTWFPDGTGPDKATLKTGAKTDIWTDNAGFKAAAANFVKAAGEYKLAADSGNLDAIRAKQQSLGMSCKGCHDKYRVKDN